MAATSQDYQVGAAALTSVVQAAVKAANIPDFELGMLPAGFLAHIEQNGAKAVIDAVDAARAKINQ
jgi:hypothetical protein